MSRNESMAGKKWEWKEVLEERWEDGRAVYYCKICGKRLGETELQARENLKLHILQEAFGVKCEDEEEW